jgi:very-short-patch-repair endonuclease
MAHPENRGAQTRDEVVRIFVDGLNKMAARCESPIEESLYWALVAARAKVQIPSVNYWDEEPQHSWFSVSMDLGDLQVFPQYEMTADGARYRADFYIQVGVFRPGVDKNPTMVVECDGHDFHERTKEQAARDRQRDRAMQREGHTVLRFTGSEIFRSPAAVAEEIVDMAERLAQSAIDRHLAKSPLPGGPR